MTNNTESWRLKGFVSKHIWESYIIILLFGLPLLYFILYHYYSPHINRENALYLLSVLAQAQAGIIAIVVALILVAVQISAQTYSPRVMDIFKDFKDFWMLIALYGFSIFVDVFVIYLAPKNEDPYINFNIIVNLAIIIAFVAFTALFPFISRTIDEMKPRIVIDKLGSKIKKEEFMKAVNQKYAKNRTQYSIMLLSDNEDNILPLMDVIKKAIRSDDITTARDGIKKLENILCELLDCDGNKDGIIKHFCEHFNRISNLSFIENNEDIIIELSESLAKVANKALNKDISQNAIEYIASLLAEIGKESSNRLWKKATVITLNSIGSIYINAEKSGILFTLGVHYVIRMKLYDIVSNSLNKDLYFVQFYVLLPLTDFCIKAIYEISKEITDKEKILQEIVINIAEVIENIGRKSLEYEKESVVPIITEYVMYNLMKIGASAADVEKNLAINDSASNIEF